MSPPTTHRHTIDFATLNDAAATLPDTVVIDLTDTWRLILDTADDHDTTINDMDCYGRMAWCTPRRDAYQGCFAGPSDHASRPAGFTGAARKLTTFHGDSFWWEPYRDASGIDDNPTTRDLVRQLVSYGFTTLTARLAEQLTDSTGAPHWVIVTTAHLGGIDQIDPFVLADVITELDITVASPTVDVA